jgi:hypothetical protein
MVIVMSCHSIGVSNTAQTDLGPGDHIYNSRDNTTLSLLQLKLIWDLAITYITPEILNLLSILFMMLCCMSFLEGLDCSVIFGLVVGNISPQLWVDSIGYTQFK